MAHEAPRGEAHVRSSRAKRIARDGAMLPYMVAAITGLVHGTVIELDAPVPALEGRRVRVVLEAEDESPAPEVWAAWVTAGPQRPLEDDGAGLPWCRAAAARGSRFRLRTTRPPRPPP